MIRSNSFFDTGTKRLSLIHLHNYESGSHQSHRKGKRTCSPKPPNHILVTASIDCESGKRKQINGENMQ